MSSWSCPYFDHATDRCVRLKSDCVPGRKGCALPPTTQFLIPPEERMTPNHGRQEASGSEPDRGTCCDTPSH